MILHKLRTGERLLTPRAPRGQKSFTCNICSSENDLVPAELYRENPTCSHCGSTVRMRAIVQVLTTRLFGRSMAIDAIDPPRPDIVGIGMSCWDGYATRLAHKIAFRNTYYHQEPFLDITDVPISMHGTLDFIVSSDVFEHVAPPVDRAFKNVRNLLKPGGILVFTVPYDRPFEPWATHAKEWYPNLHDFAVELERDQYVLRNKTKDGREEEFRDLVFHGGPGSTLEMRLFSKASVARELAAAGMVDVKFHQAPDWKHGVYWRSRCSVTISARRQP